MKKIYSLAFFRHESSAYESPRCGAAQGRFFVNFLPVVIRAFRSVFAPAGWTLRIHHDDRATEFPYFKAIQRFRDAGILELQDMGVAKSLCGSMLWRMHPAFIYEHNIGGAVFVAARDLDSLPTPRELHVLERWIYDRSGDMPVLALHDSESHAGTPLMGGMIAVRADHTSVMTWLGTTYNGFRRLKSESGINFNQHGADQVFLNHLPIQPPVHHETRETMGPRVDPRDMLSNHIGGAFHAEPARKWYDENLPDDEVLRIEREVMGS